MANSSIQEYRLLGLITLSQACQVKAGSWPQPAIEQARVMFNFNISYVKNC
jgi:hypothetical protein